MDDTPPFDDTSAAPASPDPASSEAGPPIAGPRRWIYLAGGWAFLALGALGVFLPVLPTTPFVLLAAWLFSRSSERLHRWLLEHRTFGRVVRDWEAHGVIRLRAKILATAVIVPLVGWMLLGSDAPRWTRWVTVVLVAWGLAFVWSRGRGADGPADLVPSPPAPRRPGKPPSRVVAPRVVTGTPARGPVTDLPGRLPSPEGVPYRQRTSRRRHLAPQAALDERRVP